MVHTLNKKQKLKEKILDRYLKAHLNFELSNFLYILDTTKILILLVKSLNLNRISFFIIICGIK